MRFGVVCCPNCRQARGVNLTYKSTRCSRCGKKLILTNLKIFYSTNSQQDLAQAVGKINASLITN